MIERRRFKSEEGTDYSEWEKVRIGDVFEVTRGKVLATSLTKQESNESYIYPVYSSQTKMNGLMGFYAEFLFSDAITWTTDGANAGEVRFRRGKFYCTNVCGVLLSEKYANTAVSIAINRVTHKYVSYVGNPKLMNGVMSEIALLLPTSTSEMKRISVLFEKIEDKIKLLTKKKEALETYKKGLMQKIFSQELRFKREDGTDYPEWDCISLKDVVSDFIVPMRDKPKEFDGDVDWCRIEDIENGFINGSLAGLRVSNSVISSMNLKVLPIGSVIVSCSAYLGVCARVTKPLITNQTFIGLVPNDSVTTDFIYHLMTTKERILNRLSSGTTISYLARSEFERLNIGIPCLEEQKKISSTLNITDDSITRFESQIRTNQKLKKGLLQQMFL